MNFYKSVISVALSTALLGCGGGSTENTDSSSSVAPTTPEVLPATPVFSAQPDTVSQQPFAGFSFVSGDAQTYTCQLNGEPEVPCASPYLVYPLDVQQHTLQVRAVSAGLK